MIKKIFSKFIKVGNIFNSKTNHSIKGFTLIELLIVIGILAVISSIVVLIINPVEMIARARDSQRISDFSNLKRAISMYLISAPSPILTASTTETASSTTGCPFTSCSSLVITSSTIVNGTGWAAVNLGAIPTMGSPLGALPLDPTNNGTYFYAYKASSTSVTFELAGRLESSKYRNLMILDGGSVSTCSTYTENTCFYEVGTNLWL